MVTFCEVGDFSSREIFFEEDDKDEVEDIDTDGIDTDSGDENEDAEIDDKNEEDAEIDGKSRDVFNFFLFIISLIYLRYLTM